VDSVRRSDIKTPKHPKDGKSYIAENIACQEKNEYV
jgi:hypothetical protein